MRENIVEIKSRDYWFKIVEFLQQNWALIDPNNGGYRVFFFDDTSGVFDYLNFDSLDEAELALKRNGFKRFSEDKEAQEFIGIPELPFYERPLPHGPIYSSGRYWK
ncbi:MAG: hypothetical protein KF855_07515 [Acidobacteria bacterium]|nr:hypothetical protein [Acidobacteriota bacterium]